MNVTEALATRLSVRDFLPDPIPESLLRDILTKASRAPSGGNMQPLVRHRPHRRTFAIADQTRRRPRAGNAEGRIR